MAGVQIGFSENPLLYIYTIIENHTKFQVSREEKLMNEWVFPLLVNYYKGPVSEVNLKIGTYIFFYLFFFSSSLSVLSNYIHAARLSEFFFNFQNSFLFVNIRLKISPGIWPEMLPNRDTWQRSFTNVIRKMYLFFSLSIIH